MERTERVTVTIGVVPGFGNGNPPDERATLEEVVETAINFANQIRDAGGVYLSFVAMPARAGYDHGWGCPQGGEFVVVLTGTRNPEFCKDSVEYLDAWRKMVALLKEAFGQKTARLEYEEVSFKYLKGG